MRRSLVSAAALALLGSLAPALTAPATATSGGRAAPDCTAVANPYASSMAAAAACGLAVAPRSAAEEMAGGGMEYRFVLNASTYRYYVPPAGFDYVHASDQQLREYGLPARPRTATALARWTAQMTGAVPAAPAAFLVESKATTAFTATSTNWSGYGVQGSRGRFTHAQATYTEPTFGSSRCASNSEVTWAGLGGWSSGGGLGQDGTAHGVPGLGNHQAWSEVYPLQNIIPQNLYGHAGYGFIASTRWLGSAYRYYLHDNYSGQTLVFDQSVAKNYYTGDSAEAIAERPSVNGNVTNLSNFGYLKFQQSEANDVGINNYSPTSTRFGVHMYNTAGSRQLADPGNVGSDGSFTDHQLNCN